MNYPKRITNEQDYERALSRIDELFDAAPGSPEGDELDLWVTLVELYEEQRFPIDLPDPVSAIKFRMEQEGLKAADLVPMIGSRSKVSEVLSGKRPLSLNMIRKLVAGLRIPADVLLKEPDAELPSTEQLECARSFPFIEMYRRGWFEGFTGTLNEAKENKEELLRVFMGDFVDCGSLPAWNRRKQQENENLEQGALFAWRIRVAQCACKEHLPSFRKGCVDKDFLCDVVRLSCLDKGPLLAREYLQRNGIHFVVEPALSGTKLDGAAMSLGDGSPLIAMTLRYDRLDHFWFTLLHELAHVALHFKDSQPQCFFDVLGHLASTAEEEQADALAREALVPEALWIKSGLSRASPLSSIRSFADELRISPSIPAGRIRYETGDYRVLTSLVGTGTVRNLFGV